MTRAATLERVPSLTLTMPDGDAEAYLATAPEGGQAPGVLFVIDAIGLRPRIEEMADRIASWGYTVLAPNVFYRDGAAADLAPQGDLREAGEREAFMPGAMQRVRGLTADLLARDLPAYLSALRSQPATTGHGGGLVTDEPDSPHLALRTARVAFAFGHADNDGSMPPEAVEALGAALSDAGLQSVNEVFAGPHGYSMSDTAMYDEESAERHVASLRTLLDVEAQLAVFTHLATSPAPGPSSASRHASRPDSASARAAAGPTDLGPLARAPVEVRRDEGRRRDDLAGRRRLRPSASRGSRARSARTRPGGRRRCRAERRCPRGG